MLCAAAMMSTAGRVLSEKMDVLQLAFYTAPVSSCVLMPFFWLLEVRSSEPPGQTQTTSPARAAHALCLQDSYGFTAKEMLLVLTDMGRLTPHTEQSVGRMRSRANRNIVSTRAHVRARLGPYRVSSHHVPV